MKRKAAVAAIFIFLILASLIALNSRSKGNQLKAEKDEIHFLINAAKLNEDLIQFIKAARSSRFTNAAVLPKEPAELSKKNSETGRSSALEEWTLKNLKVLSLKEPQGLETIIAAIPVGTLTLTDPRDTPLSYNREFLEIKFDRMRITEIHSRSL